MSVNENVQVCRLTIYARPLDLSKLDNLFDSPHEVMRKAARFLRVRDATGQYAHADHWFLVAELANGHFAFADFNNTEGLSGIFSPTSGECRYEVHATRDSAVRMGCLPDTHAVKMIADTPLYGVTLAHLKSIVSDVSCDFGTRYNLIKQNCQHFATFVFEGLLRVQERLVQERWVQERFVTPEQAHREQQHLEQLNHQRNLLNAKLQQAKDSWDLQNNPNLQIEEAMERAIARRRAAVQS
ncbi:MAG: hypothetical protein MHM6MM_008913 [Cercozoa sp. M6MM]